MKRPKFKDYSKTYDYIAALEKYIDYIEDNQEVKCDNCDEIVTPTISGYCPKCHYQIY
jgi:Zn finger protein HypA/HybF involved in hydrogenase expression